MAAGGRHEDAISFLTELEEELEVAQVQLELYHTLVPRIDEAGEVAEKIKFLTTRLFTVTEVNRRTLPFLIILFCWRLGDKSADMCYLFLFPLQLYQGWAEPFDLVTMKLLIYHVSQHRDDNLVRPLWSRIFDEGEDHLTFPCVPGLMFIPVYLLLWECSARRGRSERGG